MALLRRSYQFRGTVQGVGFRPTVYRCAVSLGLTGYVQNRRSVVAAEVQGTTEAVGSFLPRLREMLPPAAMVDSVEEEEQETREENAFLIRESRGDAFSFPPIPPDLAMCPECKKELLDPCNRRYLYPFITCTQCGPRYSIVMDTPFDRTNTSMAVFTQCGECLGEYRDPGDRRFHSQTNSCFACGPELSLLDADGTPLPGDPLRECIRALARGRIVALMGLGGFHLALDPRFADAISRLRSEKEREKKPFALMVRDLEEARSLCSFGEIEERELLSAVSPIAILPTARGAAEHLRGVSDTDTLGIMLPYTPLHALLFLHPQEETPYRHLVMTSGNRREEPIITDPPEALEKLRGIADLFLIHDRRILFRTDDSIIRFDRDGTVCQLRRSRGYVPRLVSLRRSLESTVLGLGGDLKNAPALGLGKDVYLAPYIGDLEDPSAQRDFQRQIEAVLKLYDLRPDVAVCDLHPRYHSTRFAEGSPDREGKGRFPTLLKVQHHHAHLLSVMAEHGLGEVIGMAFDGTGYGTDGTIWGGEFLWADRSEFRRIGSFADFALPGGEAAIRHPIRIAFSLLHGGWKKGGMNGSDKPPEQLSPFLDSSEIRLLGEMLDRGLNCPMTTSLGRLFDAASALLGLVQETTYEGEGPIKLEGRALTALAESGLSDGEISRLIPLAAGPSKVDGRKFLLDPVPLVRRIAETRHAADGASLALLFHRAIADAALRGALAMRDYTGLNRIALSGGVFQNMLLRRLLVPKLAASGFEVYLNRAVPPGDGGLSLGQVYYRAPV